MAGREGLGGMLGGVAGTIGGTLLGGPIGGTIGAGIGGYAGNAIQGRVNRGKQSNANGNWMTGSNPGFEQASQFAQWQQPYFQQLAQMASQGMQDPYQGFEPQADYARHNFMNKTIPSLAERFSSMGSNAISSPDFAANNLQAGSDFELGLNAQRSQYGMQNMQQLLQMLGMGLTPQYQNYATAGNSGALGGLFSAAAPAIGKLGANALGGYLGAQPGQGRQEAWSSVINGLKGV